MDIRLYQKCCRLCLDDTKDQIEVCSDNRLTETLQQLYNVKVEKSDTCTKKICVECFKEANEMQKWLNFYEEQKKLIAENQRIFHEELINQLGPITMASPAHSAESTRPVRSARKTFHRTDDEDEERGEKDEDFVPKKSPRIKKESVMTRRSIKKEWLPHSDGSGQESSTPTEHATDDDEEEDASETATSTTDDDLKCPKCEKVFREIDQLERHSCEFICSICSATLKYRHSLKRHLMAVHKIKANQWQEYWSPVGDNPDELLVETSKPKKRYRYESDSPTDIEEDSNSDVGQLPKDLVCSRCGDKFDTSHELKDHDCDYLCNICGVSFANKTNVKRHKIRVHKLDPNDPSFIRSRATSVSRAASRPPSRPPSRAPSEHPSDDEPLAVLAFKNEVPENIDDFRQRFFCPDCDYSNFKRNRITHHLLTFHRTPKEQIDVEAIPKKFVPKNAVFRSRSKTPTGVVPIAYRSKTPINFEPIVYQSQSPDSTIINRPPSAQPPVTVYEVAVPAKTEPIPGQHRSRSRSIHQDSRNSSKRKRSLSSCSNKSSRLVRARSNPPVDRNILVAKRRLSPSRALAQVPEKLRPTVTAIESNRLFVSIRQSCEDFPPSQQIRLRATSYISQESCPTKRLFKLKPPMGSEKQQAQKLRDVFRHLSHRISAQSKVNPIDVDSLVLDFIHQPEPEAHEPPTNTEMESQQPEKLDAEIATFEIREVGSEESTQVVVSGHEVSVVDEEPLHNVELDVKDVPGGMQNGDMPETIEVSEDGGDVVAMDVSSEKDDEDVAVVEPPAENDEGDVAVVESSEEKVPFKLAETDTEVHDVDVSIIPD